MRKERTIATRQRSRRRRALSPTSREYLPCVRTFRHAAEVERHRRALRPHRPRRVSRLAPDPPPSPSRAGAPDLRRPLQRPPATSSAQPDAAGPKAANTAARDLFEIRPRRTPRPPRWTDPRIRPRSMRTDFRTPQARACAPRRYRLAAANPDRAGSLRGVQWLCWSCSRIPADSPKYADAPPRRSRRGAQANRVRRAGPAARWRQSQPALTSSL